MADHVIVEFQDNIRQCLLWLRYSLQDQGCSYELESDRCASALKKGFVPIEFYQRVLCKISDFPDIKFKLCHPKDAAYFEEWIADLILNIQVEVEG